MIFFKTKRPLGLGSLYDYLPRLAVTRTMFLLLDYTVLCASTCDVYGDMYH
jgi:hypothetical protein